MKLRLTCREATALLLAREDRALPAHERVVLRLHLAACAACPVVERQLLSMRTLLRRWREASEGDSGMTLGLPPSDKGA